MNRLIFFIGMLILLLSSSIFAETEQEEMERLQRQLNNQVFGTQQEQVPAAPSRHVQSRVKNVKPEPKPAAAAATTTADSSGLPLETFTGYTLAGLHLTMEKVAVMEALKAAGYACNLPQAAQMAMVFGAGRTMCIFISQEAPKYAIVGFTNGRLLDLETHEMYRTEFPEEFFKRARDKFMASYQASARCKKKRKGEICEVFGHGYRILFRTEKTSNGAKIVHRVGRI